MSDIRNFSRIGGLSEGPTSQSGDARGSCRCFLSVQHHLHSPVLHTTMETCLLVPLKPSTDIIICGSSRVTIRTRRSDEGQSYYPSLTAHLISLDFGLLQGRQGHGLRHLLIITQTVVGDMQAQMSSCLLIVFLPKPAGFAPRTGL